MSEPTYRRLGKTSLGVLSTLVLLLVWLGLTTPFSVSGRSPLIDPIILPTPQAVMKATVTLFVEGGLGQDLWVTLVRLVSALLLALAVGIPLGLLFGYYKDAYRGVEGLLHALRSIPAAALFPLFLIVVGVGEMSIVLLAFYNSATVILIGTVSGAILANESRVRQARVLGMNGWQIATRVLFWESLPHIFSSSRIALGYSLALVIAVEMFIGIGDLGLGRKIFDYQAAYRIPETYATILIASALGVTLNGLLTVAERFSLAWLPLGSAE